MRDRTVEFQQIFDSNRRRDVKIQGPPTSFTVAKGQRQENPQETARFNEYAKVFASDLARASENIGHLTRLLKQRTVYDDRGEEIGSLTGAIKGQLQQLQHDMDTLAELKKEAQPSRALDWFSQEKLESSEHSDTIVNTLRSRLVKTGQEFTVVLKQRTQMLTKDATRRGNLVAASSSTPESAMFSGGLDQALEQRLATHNSTYYQSRYDAVREIELAVNEVGDIFRDFTTMVEEQNEAIIRIDQDVDIARDNVNAGTNELMKYLASLSSNRGLIIKIFAVLFVFLLFFGFVVVR